MAHLTKLALSNFRNHINKILEFSPSINIIYGENATGKTNILESIYLLSRGKSFRAILETEMINYNKDISRVKAVVQKEGEVETRLEVLITRGEIKLLNNEIQKAPRKKLIVNELPKRLLDFSGNLKTVIFGPWDMDLITASPSLRRRFMDEVLSQVDREYYRSLLSYEKGVRQRNKLLSLIREGMAKRSQLLFWDTLLIKNGDYISECREDLINTINTNPQISDLNITLTYDKSAISEARLMQYKEEEVAAATTLVGPHRDDIVFWANNHERRNLAVFGSRGEQRMVILWLKLSELKYIKEKTHEEPILLLDDIFSELDHAHRQIVMKETVQRQTIITTADEHYIEKNNNVNIIRI